MNTSLWHAISHTTRRYPHLDRNLTADVVIIGGGITGITSALQLIARGKTVVLLEAHEIGGVTTASSSGNLYIAVQPYYQNIVEKFDLATANMIAHSRKFGIDFIENTIREKNISCSFSRRPWFIYSNDEKKIAFLEKEVETLQKMKIHVQYTETLPLPFKFQKAAVMEDQARFNPLQYVIEIAAAIHSEYAKIFEKTKVTQITEKKAKCLVETDRGFSITAKKVIIATHTPIGVNPVQLFTSPYRSYAVTVKLKNNHYPEGHFWDLDNPHHATCTHALTKNYPEILLVAGSHHKTGQDKNMRSHFQALEYFLRDHFTIEEIPYHWSAQHYHSADDIPYIGLASRFYQNTYMATGYFADGLLYGTLAGILLADLITKKRNPWKKVYNATRFNPVISFPFLLKEDGNYFLQYYKDFPQLEAKNFKDLNSGEGKVVEIDREKWAVYRDENHQLHIVSAVCTHMKCIVNWNNAEKTWDCPCHGSRFTTDGKVIEGPAIKNLTPGKIKQEKS